MSIYEAFGIGAIVYFTLTGIAVHLYLLWQGKTSVKQKIGQGTLQEFEAQRTHYSVMHPEGK